MIRKGGSLGKGRERGATLVHMAIAMVAVMGFSALVIDYGIFWVGRRQAQNAADAGAHAGAVALAFDDPNDFSTAGAAQRNARGAARANLVWGEQPDVTLGEPGTTPADVSFPTCPDGTPDTCVRVDVYRATGAFGGLNRTNPLPTFFGRLVGVNTQNVIATATAQVLRGDSAACVRPWAVADKWDEFDGPETDWDTLPDGDPDWNENSTYDRYEKKQQEDDLYVPPAVDGSHAGTGYRLFTSGANPQPIDYGRQLTLKIGQSENRVSAGWFMAVRIGEDDSGAQDYCDAIKTCNPRILSRNSVLQTEQGNMVGPTRQCVATDADSLVNQDPQARWYAPNETLPNGTTCTFGCVYSPTRGVNSSPRIVPIPVFNVDEYLLAGPNGLSELTVNNLLGFFIEGTGGAGNKDVIGRLVNVPGEIASGPPIAQESNFLLTIRLVR